MKKIVIICGLISGLIIASVMAVSTALCYKSGKFEGSIMIGYTSMIIAFSLIFVGIKSYRDKYNGGFITFGKAFKIGLLISLISSSIYVLTWLIDMHFFFPDFMEKYSAGMIEKLKASGATALEVSKEQAEMNDFAVMYKNPLYRVLFTYIEVLPLGILISLIASLILKRKNKTFVPVT